MTYRSPRERIERIATVARSRGFHVSKPKQVTDRWTVIIRQEEFQVYIHASERPTGKTPLPRVVVMWQGPGTPAGIQGFGDQHSKHGSWPMRELQPFLRSLFRHHGQKPYNGEITTTLEGANTRNGHQSV